MRNVDVEDSQWFYIHEEELAGIQPEEIMEFQKNSWNFRRIHSTRRRHSTRRTHGISIAWRNPSVSPIQRQRRIPEANVLQGELSKIKLPTFNGGHRKGEEE
jgi:hypothetical protein